MSLFSDSSMWHHQEMHPAIPPPDPTLLHVDGVDLFSSPEPTKISIEPPPTSDMQQHPLLLASSVDITPPSKRSRAGMNDKQSKRAMYCRNAYMHFLVQKMVELNPYISLRSILQVLNSKQVDCKESTVAKARTDERSRFITSMKNIIPAFFEMSTLVFPHSPAENQIAQCNPEDDLVISTTTENQKALLSSVFYTYAEAKSLYKQSKKLLALDCSPLKSELGGVLFHASTLDGGREPILLAFMVAGEENQNTWREFLSALQTHGLGDRSNSEFAIVSEVCVVVDTCLPALTLLHQDLGVEASPWYLNGNTRRKKTGQPFEHARLRSLFFRALFCGSSRISNYITHLTSLAPEVVSELSKHPQWSRGHASRYHMMYIDYVLSEFEVALEQDSIAYLMLDDVVEGLILAIHRRAQQREAMYASQEKTALTPFYQQLVAGYAADMGRFTVECVNPKLYCVVDNATAASRFDVDLEKGTCSCCYWQELMFPCVHCWCVMHHCKVDWRSGVDAFFTNEKALGLCAHHALPAFTHDFSRQVKYYQQSLKMKDPVLIASESKSVSILGVCCSCLSF